MTIKDDLLAAVTKAQAAAEILDGVANGPAAGVGSTVDTAAGPVKTVSKLIADIEAEYAANAVIVEVDADRMAAEAARAAAVVALGAAEDARDQAVAAAASGGVKVTAADTNPAPLASKLVAGTAISLTMGNAGGDETLTVACTLDPHDQVARDIAISAYIKADVAGSDPAGVYGLVYSDDFEADTIGANSTGETYDAAGKCYATYVAAAAGGTGGQANSTTASINGGLGKIAGLKFVASSSGIVQSVTMSVNAVAVADTYTAAIYTNNAGTPGAVVGSASSGLAINAAGVASFAWAAGAPTLVSGTTYWVVITPAATGDLVLNMCNAVAGIVSSRANNLAGLSAEINAAYDLIIGVNVQSLGDMTLVSNAVALPAEPTDVSHYSLVEDVDPVADGVDRKVWASIDGGTTWAEAAAYTSWSWGAGERLVRADIDVTAQTGASLKWRITTHNLKRQKIKQVTGLAA